ncbi:uncharacterized protein LOC129314482 [Prosopis cineraria]|uniref:uncharacterized protein LOC129314482 n=1 Tax=Prosopis cineraria TaxID=364024 RepID=UPI00240E9DAF|nr:uncharacterized protein LOC129314482 [Prosopis cineraria]
MIDSASTLRRQIKKSPELSSKSSLYGIKMDELSLDRKHGLLPMSSPRPRPRPPCTCSNRPGSVRCTLHGYAVPERMLKKRPTSQEILRRALTPPPRRLKLRWLNFRPTPSRLSVMSMA